MSGQLKFGFGWWKTRCGWKAVVEKQIPGATYCFTGQVFEAGEPARKYRWTADGICEVESKDHDLDCVERIVWPNVPSNVSEEKRKPVEDKISPMKRQIGGDHYMNMGIQPIQVMEANFTPEKFIGYLEGNVLKYIMRYSAKGGIDDLKKAQHYSEILTSYLEKQIGKQEG